MPSRKRLKSKGSRRHKKSKESKQRKKSKESKHRKKSKDRKRSKSAEKESRRKIKQPKSKESRRHKSIKPKESKSREKEYEIKHSDQQSNYSFQAAPVAEGSDGDRIDELMPKIKKYIPKNYKPAGYLGGGAHGETYLLSGPGLVSQVLKVVNIHPTSKDKSFSESAFIHEYEMQLKFADAGIAPRPSEIGIFDKKDPYYSYRIGIVRMEKVDGTVKWLLENHLFTIPEMKHLINEIERIIKIMCNVGLIHGDLTLGNIGYNLTRTPEQFKLLLIDFGFSCCVKTRAKCDVKLELSSLFADAKRNISTEIYERNKGSFLAEIEKLMKKFGFDNISNTEKYIQTDKSHYIENVFNPDL
jgi:hypothetical protein